MFTVRVRDVMTSPAITVAQAASFREIVELMLRHGISALPVVDDTGDLLGMISDADLMTKPAHGGRRRRGHTAGGIMSAPAETADLDDTVRGVARRMVANHRKHLPVVDRSRRLVGVVSRRDVLRMFDRPDAELAADVSDALAEDQALEGHDVSVAATDGVVTIEGTVCRADDVAYVRRLAWMVPCVIDVACHLTVAETAPHHDVGHRRVEPGQPIPAQAHGRSAADVKGAAVQRIVVGVDGSAASSRALGWAVDQAHTSGAEVEAIHAWTVPHMGADPLARALADRDELEAQARRELHLVVDGADDGGLVAPVSRTLVRDDPAGALLRAGKGADLLVVGSRGLGVDGEAEPGSVSHRVIHEAPCPVVVVPAD
ncbi:MAG TPA: CBS domain-containing protein [Acidimicrobiales bacterium]|nr:CBS domain-containing protein [Acidimicrobiales bacterium]